MKPYLQSIIIFFGLIAVITSCQSKSKRVENLAPDAHQVVAKEVTHTSNYTYVNVEDSDSVYWLAINKAEIVVGKTYFWSHGAPMFDFFSKELKRKFPVIYFVDDFTDQPITAGKKAEQGMTANMQAAQMQGRQPIPEKAGISVPVADGGITIAELFSNRAKYGDKVVKIRGEVVKFSGSIMKKNWIHIQDGTKDGGIYDLTINSNDAVAVGEVAVFEGVIHLNKDFGAGYKYDVIMEDAKIIKN